ncbi:MAG: hypothetical protein ABI663_10770 [Chryseolinea sp.]
MTKKTEKDILIIDFSDRKEDQMIELIIESRNSIAIQNIPQYALVIFNEKNFFTPKFMKFLRTEQTEANALIVRQAIVGLSKTQLIILKGYNLITNRNIKAFSTKAEAIEYLLADKQSADGKN